MKNLIFEALQKGDLNGIQQCIKAGHDLNQKNISGSTPLDFAIYKGNFKAVKLLVLNGANQISPNAIESLTRTRDDNKITIYLIHNFFNANNLIDVFKSATKYGNLAITKYLITLFKKMKLDIDVTKIS